MVRPKPCERRPWYRCDASSSAPRPMSWSWRTDRGVRPSPHVFSRGKDLRSSSKTSWPALASQYAQDAPDGPAPITRTSQWCSPAGRPAVVLVICL